MENNLAEELYRWRDNLQEELYRWRYENLTEEDLRSGYTRWLPIEQEVHDSIEYKVFSEVNMLYPLLHN